MEQPLYFSISEKTVQIAKENNLTTSEMMVYAVIESFSRNGLCKISQSKMVDLTGLTRKTINQAVGKLVSVKLIIKDPDSQQGYVRTYSTQAKERCDRW